MFATLSDRLTATFKNLRGKGRLSEQDIDATVREIRVALLDADVALPVVRAFCAKVKERALAEEVSRALNPAQQVVKIVNEELIGILGGETRRLRFAKTPPTVIVLAGLQGSGKTTLAGKLGAYLKRHGHQPLLVAADLQRPNAVDQLRIVGERAGVPVFAPEPGNGVGDPVDVSRRAKLEAERALHDIVVIDTAGRLAIDEQLMRELAEIRDTVHPDETLLVVDAMIGQDAVNTAVLFNDRVGFDGAVLTKLDGDARGGAALSIVGVSGKPILFASMGEKVDDFEAFHPDRMAGRILDMGDILSLIEQAERAFDAEQAQRMAGKVERGEDFTLHDFLEQMQAVKKMGSLSKLLGMLPGMGEVKKQLEAVDDRDIDRISAIIQSMTPAEREDPRILNASRRTRIAKGAGVEVQQINALIERFGEAQKMMRQMRSGKGMPQIPGMPAMPPMPGMAGGKKGKGRSSGKPKAKQGRSGNPAKRAEQAAAAAAGPPLVDPTSIELPPQFKDLLKGEG